MDALSLSKYPDIEARTPRDRFTAKLRKLCQRLDERNEDTLSFKHWLVNEQMTSHCKVINVWVVGSYARGALTCGDLDIVVEVALHGGVRAPFNVVKSAFIGNAPGLRAYEGTPDDNVSGADFAEAIQVWAPGLDWESALAAIEIDPAAGRFARSGDDIPLRVEQHRVCHSTREELLKLRDEGVLAWRFIPLSELAGHSDFEPRDASERRAFELFAQGSASKRKAAALVFGAVRALGEAQGCAESATYDWSRTNVVNVGTLEFHFERLDPYDLTLPNANCSALAFMPSLSTRGPNGVWLIERGPNHAMTRAFSDTSVWVLTKPNGVAPLIEFGTNVDDHLVTALGVELFLTEEEALEGAQCWNEPDDAPEDIQMPRLLKGKDVANLLRGIDVVTFYSDETVLALTDRGVRYGEAMGQLDVNKLPHRQVPKRLEQLLNPQKLAA